MPEIPDLLFIRSYLERHILHRTILDVTIRQPIILRNALPEPPEHALDLLNIDTIGLRGPFITFGFSGSIDLVVNLMLAGRFQHQRKGEHELGFLCLSLKLDDGTRLNICDEEKMAKVYLVPRGEYDVIPRYREQGCDVLSPDLTEEVFRALLARHGGKQVRVFLNDQTILSAIGNAYADEILFAARIHPKTFIRQLGEPEIGVLFRAMGEVLATGAEAVRRAGQPIHVKVRDHLLVRNRKGQPCPRCGTTIRREGVRGHDVFFCPRCQPAARKLFIDWNTLPGSGDAPDTSSD